MRRATILFTAAVLVMGCAGKKASEGKKEGKTKKADQGQARPNPMLVVPAPEPLPKPGPDGVATSFPKIVSVPAPQAVAAQLKSVTANLSQRDFRKKNAARKQLSTLVKQHKGKGKEAMILARYLISRKPIELVTSGISILRTLRTQPDFVLVAVSLMGHPSDRVRSSALSLVAYGLKRDQFEQVLPFIKKLHKDPSCVVRRMALAALVTNRRKMSKPPVGCLKAALKDECPAVRAYAMRNIDALVRAAAPAKGKPAAQPPAADKEVVDMLMQAAEKSPYFLERCAALMGLGRLKVAKAEKIMAKNLDLAAIPSLTVYYVSERIPYTFSNHSSMPACAADALTALTGKRFPGRPIERVKAWKAELAKKHLTRKAPKGFCLGGRDCKKDAEVCIDMKCVPNAKAAKAYWKFVELHHCAKRKTAKWSNFLDEDRLAAGFGLHWNAEWQLRRFLKKSDKKYDTKLKAIESKPCPGQDKEKAAKGNAARKAARGARKARARAR